MKNTKNKPETLKEEYMEDVRFHSPEYVWSWINKHYISREIHEKEMKRIYAVGILESPYDSESRILKIKQNTHEK